MKQLYSSFILLVISYYGLAQSFVVNGSASKITDREFQLTATEPDQSGAVWYREKIDVNYDFVINTKIFLGNDDYGADGIAFVLQPISNTIIGTRETGGNTLGYFGIKPSLSIEFDTWQNQELNDPEEDHLAFMRNGDIIHNSINNPGAPSSLDGNIEDGKWHKATFSWKASTNILTVKFLSKTYTYKADIVKTIFNGSPYVYWGFMGATGAAFNDQRVRIGKTSFTTEPTVTLSIPHDIVKYSAPARIKLNAAVNDEERKIVKVQFFNGSTRLHTEDVYPYGFLWIDVPAGNYTFTAKAFDNSGNVTTSNAVEVSVVEENVPPVVSIISPADNTTYTSPANIRIIANAKDPNDKVGKVEFYNGATLIRTEYYYPYTYTWTDVQPGIYTITAKAYDEKGLSSTSDPVKIKVTESSLPIVSGRPITQQPDLKTTLSLRLSPIPARNTLQIVTSGLQPGKASTLSVISSSGVILKTIQSNNLNKVLQLDVSSLVSGIYIIKVASGKDIIYKQFVKL